MSAVKKPEWPIYLDDPVRAVHFALEKPECPFRKPENCPLEKQVARTLALYSEWQAAQQTLTWTRFVDRMKAAVKQNDGSHYGIYREAADAGAPNDILSIMNFVGGQTGREFGGPA